MSDDVYAVLKGLLSWASPIALGLIAFAWKYNEDAHRSLSKKSEDAMAAALKARQDAADSHSVLMDRIVTHVDESVQKAITFVKEEDAKIHNYVRDENAKLHETTETMRGHVTKLFENAEKDRELFRATIAANTQRSEDRHIEVLNAVHQLSTTMHIALAGKVDK